MFGGFFANIQSNSPYIPWIEQLSEVVDFGWSIWQPHSSVTECVTLRRDSDEAELAIGYVNGFVDTSSISTFKGAANIYVVAFHGYGRTATENVAANQLEWVESGGINNMPGVKIRQQGSSGNSFYSLSSSLVFNGDFTTSTVFKQILGSTGATHPTFYHTATARYWLNFNRGLTNWRMILTPNTPSFVGVFQDYSLTNDYLLLLERDVSNNIINTTNNVVIEDSNPYTINRNATKLLSRMDAYNDLDTFIFSELMQKQTILSSDDKAIYYENYASRFNQ